MALLVFVWLLIAQPSAEAPEGDSAALRRLLADNLSRGRVMQALHQIETLAGYTGWTPDLLRMAGEIWYGAGDPARAAAYWAAVPDDLPTLRHLSRVAVELQDWPQAAGALRRLLALAPDDRWANYQLGLIEAGANPEAARVYLRAAAQDALYRDVALELLTILDAGDAHLPMQIGMALAGRGLWASAELAFEQAAGGSGPLAEALAFIALARDQQGKDGRASIERALRLAPRSAQVRYLQGLHLRAAGDLPGSLQAFELAAALDPLNPAYAAELSTAYRLVDNLGSAEYWLRHAVALAGDDPRFRALLDSFYEQVLPN